MKNKIRKCPRCGKTYTDFPALSRRDNKTNICPECGTAEAFEDFLGSKYEGEPYWLDEGLLTEGAANSNGIYSLYDGWLKRPVKDDIPDYVELEPELSDWLERAESVRTIEDVDSFVDDVYILRQGSLLEGGEYSKGNLIFKELRNRGILQKMKDMKVEFENQEMSLAEDPVQQANRRVVEMYDRIMEKQSLPGAYDKAHRTINPYVINTVSLRTGRSGKFIEALLEGVK